MSSPEATPSAKGHSPTIHERAISLAGRIRVLDPGDAAELRRMSPGDQKSAGAPAFWRIWSDMTKDAPGGSQDNWEWLAHALALLTPKGRDANKPSAHDPSLSLGKALSQADYSELRLTALLSAGFARRRETLADSCRTLAQKNIQCDAGDLADLLLFENARFALRKLAGDYYGAQAKKSKPTKEGDGA